ncbi:MAG: S41 family peptidase [Bacteroidota bacterium]
MRTINKWFVLILLITAVAAGCKEDPIPDPGNGGENGNDNNEKQEAPELTQKINGFIEAAMNDIYLWYDKIPEIDIRYEFDPETYFEKLIYSEDNWSYITDDVDALRNSFEGKEKSFGYSLAFGTFSNTGDYFAIVEFVYPNTPADLAGLKRGDIIMELNNGAINDDNYRELLNGDNISVTLGVLGEQGISPGSTVSITSRELNLNPLVITDIVDHEGAKIGYLFYAQYISEYNSSLDTALQFFLDEQITDLVIDLRYNPGGVTTAAQHLCSSIAPLSTVNGKEALVTFQWNDKYQNYWKTNNITDQLEIPFVDTTAVKMGLNKIYFLTGSGTASASELTIAGLEPYMDVTTIGESTYGKYTGSITVTPDFYYENEDYYSEFDNWGIQPIVVRYANSLGITNFKNGFSPDIPVDDELFDAVPLGDKSEPLLKAALEDITGTPVIAMKKAKAIDIPYTIFDRGFSKYDANKREMLLDNTARELLGK